MDYTNNAYIQDNDYAMDTTAHSFSSASTVAFSSDPQMNPINNQYEVVVVSSVGMHVEGPIPFINPEIPVEQHAIVQIESNEVENINVDSDADTVSVASSHHSEESNQSELVNKEVVKEESFHDEDDGRLCPICLDNWTNTGDHRICALKCGHLFGYKCVNRWLESQTKKLCPTCKRKVSRGDLRFIYAKKLIAVDTTELELIKKQLDIATEEKNKVLLDMSKFACREHMLNQEIQHLKKQIQDLSHKKSDPKLSSSFGSTSSSYVRLFMDKSMEICRYGGCRVFDATCRFDLLMASMKSPNSLFSGFGLRKVNISQYKPLAFIPLHTLQIRDVCFHEQNNWVLTASMDKSFKVVDTNTNSVLFTTTQEMPLWSCCWDADNPYILYIGKQSGAVVKYDVRNLSTPVSNLDIPGDMSPVVSVASIPSSVNGDLRNGGVISCKLNSLWVFENAASGHIRHPLSLESPFVSMKYEKESRQLLISSRPNNRISYSRHTLCTLDVVQGDHGGEKINCNVLHSFQGGGMQKLLSKSCFLSDKQNYIAAYHESSKSVHLWSINTGQRVCTVPAHEAVLDLGGIQNQSGNYLLSLTEKKLEFFKFT
ncbi:unnamed protein product [Brassicogethes aeneus]|uniref:RING-type E3 ubiquitin transferase n=1 Tax=Brassicogethes aeneus TaxID=1431903 RepID=A0A9P0FD09_BRAAE|nr:unnamed protein product [Brassicogethes aeneus]